MLSKRDIDRIAGILLISIFVAFTIFIGTFVDFDIDRGEVRDSLQDIMDDEALYVTSWAFKLAGSLLLIVAAGALYRVFTSHEQALALFGLVGLLAAGVAFIIAAITHLGVLFLAWDFLDASGAEADALVGTARAFGLLGFGTEFTGLTLLGARLLPIGVLNVRTRAAPTWLGWWAVVSGFLLLLSWGIVNTSNVVFILPAIGGIGTILFFLMLGILLLIRGSPEAASA